MKKYAVDIWEHDSFSGPKQLNTQWFDDLDKAEAYFKQQAHENSSMSKSVPDYYITASKPVLREYAKVKPNTNNVYVVMVNSDLSEGKGPMVVKAVASSMEIAKEIAIQFEPYNYPGQFTYIETWPVLNKAEEQPHIKKEKLKKQALSKLTAEERKALGV